MSLFGLAYSAHMLAIRPVVGRPADRRGTRPLLYGGLVLMAVGIVLMGPAMDTMGFALMGALCGAASGRVRQVGPVMVLRGVPPSDTAATAATYFLSVELAAGLGPWILGGVIPLVGYGRRFDLLSLVSLAILAAFWLLTPLLRDDPSASNPSSPNERPAGLEQRLDPPLNEVQGPSRAVAACWPECGSWLPILRQKERGQRFARASREWSRAEPRGVDATLTSFYYEENDLIDRDE
ncbi:MFS transporter [Planosporangium sp. 12N6]|uniref:MFS transporter n=1 Tax=Planosporangium spinosum TaxID=3402278 RepID=UPI003CF1C45F